MKKIFFLLIIISLYISNINAQLLLSVEDCRNMAIENSEDLKIASYQYDMALVDQQAVKTSYFPKLSGSASYAYVFKDIDMGMEFDLTALGMPGMNIPIDMEMSLRGAYMAGISLQQPVYVGGKIVNGNKMAKAGVEIREMNKQLTQMNTIADAESAYWIYVSVNDKVKLLNQYALYLDSLHNNVENYYKLKMATESDLQKIRTKRSNIQYELQKAQNGLNLSRISLCNMIGVDMNTSIIATDTVINISNNRIVQEPDVTIRPEYRMLQKQLEIKELSIKNTRADFLPTIGVSAGYNYVGGMKFAGSEFKMNLPMVMANISIPIFHFGEGAKKIKSARIAYDISLLELNKNSKLMNIEMQHTLSEFRSAYLLIETAEISLKQAEDNLKLVNNNYEFKMSTIYDVLDAQTQWQEAYSNVIEAKTNYKIKEIEYLKSTGKLE